MQRSAERRHKHSGTRRPNPIYGPFAARECSQPVTIFYFYSYSLLSPLPCTLSLSPVTLPCHLSRVAYSALAHPVAAPAPSKFSSSLPRSETTRPCLPRGTRTWFPISAAIQAKTNYCEQSVHPIQLQ